MACALVASLDSGLDGGSSMLAFLQALSALLLVLALVWFGRKKLAQGGLFARRGERLQIEERLALDLRNALLIVRVEQRRLLLSVGEHGPARLLLELPAKPATAASPAPSDAP